jgi:hypothetical protein
LLNLVEEEEEEEEEATTVLLTCHYPRNQDQKTETRKPDNNLKEKM